MPFLSSELDLCRSMGYLNFGEMSYRDFGFSEKVEWDGDDALAMQLLTISCCDDLSSYNEDSGCGSSRSSSVSSGCLANSWESLAAIFGPTYPKAATESSEFSNGLDIKIDLGTTIRNFQTAVLPFGNINMLMNNRSQYHRLTQPTDGHVDDNNYSDDEGGDNEKVHEFLQVKCACCSFLYTVPSSEQ